MWYNYWYTGAKYFSHSSYFLTPEKEFSAVLSRFNIGMMAHKNMDK